MRALVESRECNPYFRANVASACLRLADDAGTAELEATLDWLAALAADESQEWECRLMLSQYLRDLPRERHRPLLEELAACQTPFGVTFDAQDVCEAYGAGRDQPEWERFNDPWEFYQPEMIAARQRRWASERYDFTDDPEDGLLLPEVNDAWRDSAFADDTWVEPYVRSEPKIGRNDPCPCGSGRKYKKCCLGKTG